MIVGDKVILRAIEREDLSTLAAWREDPRISKFFYEECSISMPAQEIWFQKLLADTDRIMWVITDKITGDRVGLVGLSKIDWRNRKVLYGPLFIGVKEYQGRGYARDTEELILDYVFNYLNLHKIYGEVLCYATKVIELHKKSGFKIEGVLCNHVFKNGEYHDVILVGLLEEEYKGGSNSEGY